MKKVQIKYPTVNRIIKDFFKEEANAMKRAGFIVEPDIEGEVDLILIRDFTLKHHVNYPINKNMIQGWNEYKSTLSFSEYISHIDHHLIPTEMIHTLDESTIIKIMKKRNWDKVFIKSNNTSLFFLGYEASVYPTTPIIWMAKEYKKIKEDGPFAIRKFIDDPEIFYNEQRYWILNGNAYHPSGIIPDFVRENGKKIYEFSGSHYFTMDVAGNYIVEINPGESSDRGGDNPLDWFCDIFAKEFLY